MTARIREATEEDAEGIASVHIAAWRAAYAGLIDPEVLARLSLDDRARRWREIMAAANGDLHVAERDRRVVGFASHGPTRDDDDDPARVRELYAIYVDPGSWRRGVGRALLEPVRASASGGAALTVWVLEGNGIGRAFYEREGFAPDGGRKTIAIGRDLVELRYRRGDSTAIDFSATSQFRAS